MASSQPSRPIIVLGAGIIGLTTAIRLAESSQSLSNPPPIHILADHLPNDPLDPKYASTAAGAHHLSFADDDDARQRRWDKKTFNIMYEEWRKQGEATGLMLLKQTELFVGTDKHLKIYEDHPQFTILDSAARAGGVDHAVSFQSLTMTPVVYLNRLLSRLKDLKVDIHRHHLSSLSALVDPQIQACIGTSTPLAVIVCTGIGARTLANVEDTSVYPTRGQIVKVQAPWVRSGFTRQVGQLGGGEGGERTYVIPRPDGEVILGGTREENDWYPYPRPDTTRDILIRAAEICPSLIPASSTAPPLGESSDAPQHIHQEHLLQSLVVETIVGFRPSRRNGIRLERGEDICLSQAEPTAVVFNYGHGGAGWQSCWGTADDAVSLVMELVE